MRLCGVSVSSEHNKHSTNTNTNTNAHQKHRHSEREWFSIYVIVFVIASLANPPDGKAFMYVRSLTRSHTHTHTIPKSYVLPLSSLSLFVRMPFRCVCKFIANQKAWQLPCEKCFPLCSQTAIAVQTLQTVHCVQRNFKNRFRFFVRSNFIFKFCH